MRNAVHYRNILYNNNLTNNTYTANNLSFKVFHIIIFESWHLIIKNTNTNLKLNLPNERY